MTDTRRVEPASRGIFDQPSTLVFPAVVSGFALLALAAPLGDAEEPLHRVGALLAIAGLLQILHGVRRADLGALRRAVGGGVLSTLMGLLVLSTPSSSIPAVVLLLAAAFAVEGVVYVLGVRHTAGRQRQLGWLAAAGDLAAAAALLMFRNAANTWIVAGAVALRLFGIAWAMIVTPVHTAEDAGGTVLDDLGLADRPEAVELLAGVTFEERVRASSDRRWTIAFLVTLFAIHSARLETDGTLLGYASPAIAVVGDIVLAFLFAFVIVAPLAVSLRTSTRWLERVIWRWYLSVGPEGGGDPRADRENMAQIPASHGDASCARPVSRFPPRCGAAWRPACRSPRSLPRPSRCGV